MRDARALEQAAADASRTAAELKRAEEDRRSAAETHTRALGRLATASKRFALAQETLDGVLGRLAESGAAVRLDIPRTQGAPEAALRREADEATARRRCAVEHVEELATLAERAGEAHSTARSRADEADEDVVHSAERLAEAEESAARAGRALVTAVREHLTGYSELRVPGLPGVLDVLQDWVSSLDGPHPARVAASGTQRTLASHLDDRIAGLSRDCWGGYRKPEILTVRLKTVDEILRRSGVSPDGLAPAVVALTGPVTLRAEARRSEELAWEEVYAPFSTPPAELAGWAERMRKDGLVRRLARTPDAAGPLVATTVRALRCLPALPPTSRAAFAAQHLAGAHSLDEGTPLAALVLSGLRALTGFPDGAGAAWRREAWASAGLLKDDVSSTVLSLTLRGNAALDWMADAGEPTVLTLRSLTRETSAPAVPTTGIVHLCENPAVLSAAAETVGPACPPLVCLQGQPSAAALTLLRRLSARGAGLLYHGDFDWGGMRIATALRRSVPWQPCRYTAAHYRAAVARAVEAPDLTGSPAETPWDPALAAALAEHGVRVEEEAVLDELLADLQTHARSGAPTFSPHPHGGSCSEAADHALATRRGRLSW